MLSSRLVASEQPKISPGKIYNHPDGPIKVVNIYRDLSGQQRVSYTLNGHGDHGDLSVVHFIEEFGNKERAP